MSDRPIIMPAPDVRALLAGRKTQHRVVLKPFPPRWCGLGYPRTLEEAGVKYTVGMRLWVRETYGLIWPPGCDDGRIYDDENTNGRPLRPGEWAVEYRADLPGRCTDGPGGWPRDEYGDLDAVKWHSSATMPRWASRITLIVTDVRVQRDDPWWMVALSFAVQLGNIDALQDKLLWEPAP